MMEINPETIKKYYEDLKKSIEAGGYHLNPDLDFTLDLIEGLMVNENRYGYPSCPCRLSTGVKADDLDIICPCDYRDADVLEYGVCFCALYVSLDVLNGKVKPRTIPERRPPSEIRKRLKEEKILAADKGMSLTQGASLPYPIWRCDVCGYICARDNPPEVCPICKAKKERFSRFL